MAIEIPIKNIYYMLCYSYSILKEKDNINLSNEKLPINIIEISKYKSYFDFKLFKGTKNKCLLS